jgi:hypothetical protein
MWETGTAWRFSRRRQAQDIPAAVPIFALAGAAMLKTVLKWRHAGNAAGNRPKVALIAKSDFQADFHYGLIACSWQPLRPRNSKAV